MSFNKLKEELEEAIKYENTKKVKKLIKRYFRDTQGESLTSWLTFGKLILSIMKYNKNQDE